MIGRDKLELSARRQCERLRLSRSGLHHEPEPTNPELLALMRRIDELHRKCPFYGSRKLADVVRREGQEVNRKRIQRLMRLMGLEAMAPKPRDPARCGPVARRAVAAPRMTRLQRPRPGFAPGLSIPPPLSGPPSLLQRPRPGFAPGLGVQEFVRTKASPCGGLRDVGASGLHLGTPVALGVEPGSSLLGLVEPVLTLAAVADSQRRRAPPLPADAIGSGVGPAAAAG